MYLFNTYIPIDKLKHFLVSLLVFLVIFYVRKFVIKNKWNLRVLAFTIRDVIVLWLFKEFIDIFGFWNPEIKDLVADTYWILLPIYIYYIVKESKKLEKSKLFKYEFYLINMLKIRIINMMKKSSLLLKIKYRQLFFRRKIILALEHRVVKYYFRKSCIDLLKIIKSLILFSFVWFINLIILLFKIPFLALYDMFRIISKSVDFWVRKV